MSIEDDSLVATNKFYQPLKKLIEPLESYFGIGQFCYELMFTDGSAVHINTDPAVIEYFAYNDLYSADPHQVTPNNIGSGLAAWQDCNDYSDVVGMMQRDFDMDNGISYIEKHANHCEIFTFSSSRKNKKMQRKVYDNSKYLLKFIEYLKVAAAPIFKQSKAEYKIDLAAIKDNYYTQPGIIPNELDDKSDLVQLLVKIGLVDPKLANVKLSPQERRCVVVILEGKSIKQTALELKLSNRTVEGYLSNARQKLGISYTRDLFDLKASLIELGMLS